MTLPPLSQALREVLTAKWRKDRDAAILIDPEEANKYDPFEWDTIEQIVDVLLPILEQREQQIRQEAYEEGHTNCSNLSDTE